MKILYFAWLREQIGTETETAEPPPHIQTIGTLLDWLREQSPRHEKSLANRSIVRVAVNQVLADDSAMIGPEDEIAIFPPMTGG